MNTARKTTRARPRSALEKALSQKIHIAKNQLGLSDPEYRAVLEGQFGVSSSTELGSRSLAQLLDYFRAHLGWQDTPRARRKKDSHGRPTTLDQQRGSRQRMMTKIEAMLAQKGTEEGKHIPWSYAASILQRQCGVERLEFANCSQLAGVIAALERDARRKGRPY